MTHLRYAEVETLFEHQKWAESIVILKDLLANSEKNSLGTQEITLRVNLSKALLLNQQREEGIQVLIQGWKKAKEQRQKVSEEIFEDQIQRVGRAFLHRDVAQKFEDGLSLIKVKGFEASIKKFREVIQSDHSMFEAWLRLGQAAIELKDMRLAEESFVRAETLNPIDSEVQIWLARLRTMQGKPHEAVRILENLNEKSEERVTLLAEGYLLLGRLQDGIRILENQIRNQPLDLQALLSLAQMSLLQAEPEPKKLRAAEKHLKLILSREEDYRTRARLAMFQEKWKYPIKDSDSIVESAKSLLQQIERKIEVLNNQAS